MSRAGRKKELQKPHLALLVLLSLGIIAQSLLSISGETHEFLLHADAGQTYTHLHTAHAHESENGRDGAGTESPLHVLLHQPCAGHCAWMAGMPPLSVLPTAASADIPDHRVPRVAGSVLPDPSRPPIQI